MTDPQPADDAVLPFWAARAADRSPSVQRARDRSLQRARDIVDAAQRLAAVKGSDFTTHELVKEAGIAVQTFYKHFGGKDQVLLAVIENMIAAAAADLVERGAVLPDPVHRLRFYVTELVESINAEGAAAPVARFITTEHWRLQQLYPLELAAATSPVTALFVAALRDAVEAGSLKPTHPEYDAWLATQLILAVFHHYAFAPADADPAEIGDRVWSFCFAAWGGRVQPEPARRTLRPGKRS